jgi:hypothetical protein
LRYRFLSLRFALLAVAALLVPGTAMAQAAGAAIKAQPGPGAPQSASGCSGHVCIYLQTSGSLVTDWETTAYAGTATCTYADFWANGVLEAQTGTQCVPAGTELRSDLKGVSFPSGTLLCNTWPGISGEPCETIR